MTVCVGVAGAQCQSIAPRVAFDNDLCRINNSKKQWSIRKWRIDQTQPAITVPAYQKFILPRRRSNFRLLEIRSSHARHKGKQRTLKNSHLSETVERKFSKKEKTWVIVVCRRSSLFRRPEIRVFTSYKRYLFAHKYFFLSPDDRASLHRDISIKSRLHEGSCRVMPCNDINCRYMGSELGPPAIRNVEATGSSVFSVQTLAFSRR